MSILCVFLPGTQIWAYFLNRSILTYFFLHFKIAIFTLSNLFIRFFYFLWFNMRGVYITCFLPGIQTCAYFLDSTTLTYIILNFLIAILPFWTSLWDVFIWLIMSGVYVMCFPTRKIKSAYIWKTICLTLFCISSVSCFYCCFAGRQVIVQFFDSILITLHIQYIAALPFIHSSPLNRSPPHKQRNAPTHI